VPDLLTHHGQDRAGGAVNRFGAEVEFGIRGGQCRGQGREIARFSLRVPKKNWREKIKSEA
jgi:hypothetical protein